ncbi:hypothetical protein AB3S75_021681 [Citrus x aurantiifolia]
MQACKPIKKEKEKKRLFSSTGRLSEQAGCLSVSPNAYCWLQILSFTLTFMPAMVGILTSIYSSFLNPIQVVA